MKPIYCTESQDRIPPESFKLGKAVWSGGKPYLKKNADRLKLVPDATPPAEFAWLYEPQPAPAALQAAANIPVPPTAPAGTGAMQTIVCVSNLSDPGDSIKPKLSTPGASSTIHGQTTPIKDPLVASTLRPPSQEMPALRPTAVDVPKVVQAPPAALVPVLEKTLIEKSPLADALKGLPAAAALVSKIEAPNAKVEITAAGKPPLRVPAKVSPVAAADLPVLEKTLLEKSPLVDPLKVIPAVGAPAAKVAAPPVKAEITAAGKPPLPAGAPVAAKVAAPVAAKPAVPIAAGDKAAVPGAAVTAAAKAPAAPVKKEPARVLAEATLGYGERIPVEDLMKLPIFDGIPVSQIERLPGAIVKRVFKPGEIVCREGQYGSTAFYIVSGSADVYIDAPINHVKSDKRERSKGLFGIVRKFTTRLAGKKDDPRDGESRQGYIPNDGPMDLPMSNPVAEMRPGDLFGEMSCMSFYPRSATVRAKTECVMYEMLRNMLTLLQKNKKFKEQVDKNYRERALAQHLRSVPILKDYVDDNVIDQLRNRVALIEYDPGEIIIKQGDPSDAFYLVRVGCVKVSQTHPGGEIVLTYLGRGEYFGEIGLLKNTPRTATCTALDHVEVVKIAKADFDFILSTYDQLNEKLVKAADERTKATQHMSQHAPAMPLDDFIAQGLMGAQNLLLLDLEKCTRCDECVRACADSHDGVTRLVREGLRFDKFLVPTSCRSCMDPVCMIGCPVGSIRRKDSMEILIEDWCIGCEVCAKQCPYGNISMHSFDVSTPAEKSVPAPKVSAGAANPSGVPGAVEKAAPKKADTKDKAVTCDLCTELKEPSCVYACPHDAAHRVNAREFFVMGTGGEIKK